jgi:uncharacterized delta-60 repeat protein
MKKITYSVFAVLAACGDGNPGASPDAATPPDSTLQADASVDAPSMFVKPTPVHVPLSAAGPDQLMSVTPGPSGSFYAAGFAAQTVTGAKFVVVVKLTATGALDTTFASGGIYTSTLEFKGGTDEIDVVTQSDGKIVVSATIANATDAADRDIGLFRVDAAGAIDNTFGPSGNGTTRIDLNTAHNNGTMLVGLDSARSLAVGPSNTLFLHAVSRGTGTASGGGPRIDTDFTVAKLSAIGVLDTTWATDGKHLVDIQESNATAKGLRALADGSVIAGGYANSPGVGTVQPVLYRLTPAGMRDSTFAGGLFHETVLTVQTEVYNFALDGDKITTAGYGRNSGTANDWVSLRFNATTGARDMTFGGAPNGAVLIDPSGAMLGSNCRNAIALPGGKTALLGSTGPSNMPAQDAAVAILTSTGKLDTTYGTGVNVFALGPASNDQFWGGAVANDALLVSGWRGGGSAQTDTTNDDSHVVVFALK